MAVSHLLCFLPLCLCVSGTADPVIDGVHNPVFDQQALLGSHNVEEFTELPEDVRHTRLTNLAKSHDHNNNDIIEPDELLVWVVQSFIFVDNDEAIAKFHDHDENKDGNLTFSEIIHVQFGFNSLEELKDSADFGSEEEKNEALQLVDDDVRRFETADLNKDQILDEDESRAFFLPHNYPHMYPLEMEKAMKGFDKDGDGFVSREEFRSGDEVDDQTRAEEMAHFHDLDLDLDDRLSAEEVFAMGDNDKLAKDEVTHLLEVCDMDKDGKLSIEEIVMQEEELMSSPATDYGRIIHFVKDEF